jgi:hypothetical protein
MQFLEKGKRFKFLNIHKKKFFKFLIRLQIARNNTSFDVLFSVFSS